MAICESQVYLMLFLWLTLSNIMFFISIRFSKANLIRILLVNGLFQLVLLIDVQWMFYMLSSVCKGST